MEYDWGPLNFTRTRIMIGTENEGEGRTEEDGGSTMKRILQFVLALIGLAAATSSVLFLIQGGFGGGHGRFDRAIGILGFPWVLIPWPDVFFRFDFVPLVLLPFVINLGIVTALMGIRQRTRRAG
jgi:hypothetical protein